MHIARAPLADMPLVGYASLQMANKIGSYFHFILIIIIYQAQSVSIYASALSAATHTHTHARTQKLLCIFYGHSFIHFVD